MKLVAPISAPEDVPVLARAGADEFYCGLVPREWQMRFGRSTLNRRMTGNLHTFGELELAVANAHALGKSISVACNAQSYPRDRWTDLLTTLDGIAAAGADALIIGDFALLATLAGRRLPLRIHLSSVASCHNAETAALAVDLGAVRVILPRHVTLAEMETMCGELPGLEIESFVLNDGCVFEEGSCHTLHLPGPLGGPICLDRYRYEYRRGDGAALAESEAGRLRANDEAWDQWLWHTFSCGFTVTPEGLPYGPCGLCAIPRLAAAGVHAVKIAGRESPLERRLRSVEVVRAVLDRDGGEAQVAAFAQGLRKRPDLCQSGFMCYYREVLWPAGGRARSRAGQCSRITATVQPTAKTGMGT